MIKSVEAVVAVMILFLFIITLFSSYTKTETRENLMIEKSSEIFLINAQNKEFRDYIQDNKGQIIYNELYSYIDSNYSIKICDFLEESENCEDFGDVVPDKKSISSFNYYFYDINKTLNIIVWS